jgi:DNA-binding LacI/PurR family transcriptional regulator
MKYLDIADELKKEIERKTYPPGSRIPHTLDLAKAFKVSQMTIARAVQMLARDGFVRRIKSKGTFVQEVKKKSGFSSRPDRRIGFLFHGHLTDLINTHFMNQAYAGAEGVCRRAGKSLIPLPDEGKPAEDYFRDLDASQVGGMLIYSMYSAPLYRNVKAGKTPAVCLDFIDYSLPVDQVTTDHLKAGALTMQKLHELKHQQIIFFGNYLKSRQQNDVDHEYWWQAIQAEAKRLKLKRLKSCFIPFEPLPAMKERVRKALSQNPDHTGYVCASTTYFTLLKEVLENEPGFEAERDVVLFADWREDKWLNGRKVFQCRWDTRAIGSKAAEILADIIAGGPHKPMIHYLPVEIQ